MTAGTLEDFWHSGWSQESIFGHDFELCSECTTDMKKFLNVEDGEDDRTANDSQLGAL